MTGIRILIYEYLFCSTDRFGTIDARGAACAHGCNQDVLPPSPYEFPSHQSGRRPSALASSHFQTGRADRFQNQRKRLQRGLLNTVGIADDAKNDQRIYFVWSRVPVERFLLMPFRCLATHRVISTVDICFAL